MKRNFEVVNCVSFFNKRARKEHKKILEESLPTQRGLFALGVCFKSCKN